MTPAGRRRLPLRWRVTATFALLALAATVAVAVATYALAGRYLLEQRERLATRQAFLNARLVLSQLRSSDANPADVITSASTEAGTQLLLRVGGTWYSSAVAVDPDRLPADLLALADQGAVARQRFSSAQLPQLAVAIPLPDVDALYVEVASLAELERTMRALGVTLAVASAVTTVAAAGVGWFVARRLLHPLRRMSEVAVEVAAGDLGGRLDSEGDGDLEPLVASFNDMVDSLQQRIQREARFASDVSHELRTPLTAMITASSLVQRRVHGIDARTDEALEVLGSQVAYFEALVLDLLEISRLEAGAEALTVEETDVLTLATSLSSRCGAPTPIPVGPGPWTVTVDKTRLARVVSNLLENAVRYAGAVHRVMLRRDGGELEIVVEDQGPGIRPEERSRVFERFWRGAAARRTAPNGSGLGLAIVEQHLQLMDGSIRIDETPGGGASFVVRVPVGDTAEPSGPLDLVPADRTAREADSSVGGPSS